MNQLIRIGTGICVKGSHGLLISNPNASTKLRIRSKVMGKVENTVAPHKWNVVFDYDAKSKTISSRSLIIFIIDAGIPLDKEDAVDTDPNVSIDVCSFWYCHRKSHD
mmetsp:Transcript_2306/g.2446  ORF Transcript_2306/g.2446 Transcript_2306/m.2446 type:complete len:107 (-) Transcript_2306:1858-2178(-)